MTTLKHSLVAAAALIALALAFTLIDSRRAAAQGMRDLPASDRVFLEYRPGTTSAVCPQGTLPVSRIFPDGTVVPSFTVPAGRMLVLTDLEGVVRENIPWTVGWVASLDALMASDPSRLLLRASGQVNSAAASGGTLPVSEHLQSGVVVGANLDVCVRAIVTFANGFGVARVSQARLQGYLISE